jgi:hypothetical protein
LSGDGSASGEGVRRRNKGHRGRGRGGATPPPSNKPPLPGKSEGRFPYTYTPLTKEEKILAAEKIELSRKEAEKLLKDKIEKDSIASIAEEMGISSPLTTAVPTATAASTRAINPAPASPKGLISLLSKCSLPETLAITPTASTPPQGDITAKVPASATKAPPSPSGDKVRSEPKKDAPPTSGDFPARVPAEGSISADQNIDNDQTSKSSKKKQRKKRKNNRNREKEANSGVAGKVPSKPLESPSKKRSSETMYQK